VWSQHSNHFVKNDAVLEYILANGHDSRVEFVQLEPMKGLKPLANETRKRNHGIEIAKKKGFDQVLISDADEFWYSDTMNQLKIELEHEEKLNGFVHPLRVFIKSPTLWCEDHTLVPGIQRLTKKFYVGNFSHYPYAYEGLTARIDPSRRPNTLTGIKYVGVPMSHMSYVRKDIDLKINNSSANLKKSREAIHEQVRNAVPGYKSGYGILKECPNYFNIVI